MIEALLGVTVVLVGVVLALVVAQGRRLAALEEAARQGGSDRVVASLREELARGREEAARQARELREEVAARLREAGESATTSAGQLRADLVRAAAEARAESTAQAERARAETAAQGEAARADLRLAMAEDRKAQAESLAAFGERIETLRRSVNDSLVTVRETVDKRLQEIGEGNARKLDEIRKTVDEQLQSTLEKRLGESFKLVGDNLDRVAKGLGEMQSVAAGVGDLKRVLTNVKTRGTWGEVQLGNLLAEMMTPEQYATNVATRPGSADRVEFAVKLPGRGEGEAHVWLPIDAKFPVEDYERLVAAADRADPDAVAKAGKDLEDRVRGFAKLIREKYIEPPHTTDFGFLYLPTEGLYAELLRRPGLAASIQHDHRVVLAGPTTILALINSLQVGFRTLAIERRSGEIQRVLGAVKTEFGKFGEVLDKVRERIEQAGKQLEATGVRSRAMERKLREVEALPADEASAILPQPEAAKGDDGSE